MATVTDPVCGMQIDSSQAEAQTMYNGTPYYFCSQECRKLFEANPKQYVTQASAPSSSDAGQQS